MTDIQTEDGIWRKQKGMSDVGRLLDEGGLKDVEPAFNEDGSTLGCIICQGPASTMAMMHSWRDHDGEPVMFTSRVCQAHRGQWWWIPNEMQYAWDAATQRSMN